MRASEHRSSKSINFEDCSEESEDSLDMILLSRRNKGEYISNCEVRGKNFCGSASPMARTVLRAAFESASKAIDTTMLRMSYSPPSCAQRLARANPFVFAFPSETNSTFAIILQRSLSSFHCTSPGVPNELPVPSPLLFFPFTSPPL